MTRSINYLLKDKVPATARVLTFDDGFHTGKLDRTKWPDSEYGWNYLVRSDGTLTPRLNGRIMINEEDQYYVIPDEIVIGGVPDWPTDRPWFFRVINGKNMLVISAVPRTPAYDDIAYVGLEGFITVSRTANTVTTWGQNYGDRDAPSGQSAKHGVNRYLAGNRQLRLYFNNTKYQVVSFKNDQGGADGPDIQAFNAWEAGKQYKTGQRIMHQRLSDGVHWIYQVQVDGLAGATWDEAEEARYTPVERRPTFTFTLATPFDVLPEPGQWVNIQRQQDVLSGALTTRHGFAQKYGSFEWRGKFPKGSLCFAAVWLWPLVRRLQGANYKYADTATEFDMGEPLGHLTEAPFHNIHSPETTWGGYTVSYKDMFLNETPLDHSNCTPTTPGWTEARFQQHQVLIPPGHEDFYDLGAEFGTLRFDWYPPADTAAPYGPSSVAGRQGNTCACFVQMEGWDSPRQIYEMYMSPDTFSGVCDEHILQLNNAYGGAFVVGQEERDLAGSRAARCIGVTPAPWEFITEYFRVYQWPGQRAGGPGWATIGGWFDPPIGPIVGDPGDPDDPDIEDPPLVELPGLPPMVPESQALYKDAVFRYRQPLPVGVDLADVTFEWRHSLGAAVTIVGPSNQQIVTLRVVEDAVTATPGSVTCRIPELEP